MNRPMIYHVPEDGWLAAGWYIAGREDFGPYETRAEAEADLALLTTETREQGDNPT